MIPIKYLVPIRKVFTTPVRRQQSVNGNENNLIDSDNIKISYTLKEKFDVVTSELGTLSKSVTEIKVFDQIKVSMGLMIGLMTAMAGTYFREFFMKTESKILNVEPTTKTDR